MTTPTKTLPAIIALALLALLAPLAAIADDAHHKPVASSSATAGANAADLTDGEVRKIDMEAGKVTLRHAEIKSLDMPPMTMVFVVKDKAILSALKLNDKVKFKAINDGGKLTVTEIHTVP